MILAILLRLLAPIAEKFKIHRRTQFEALPLRDVDVLLVGDSITEGGLWDEWLPGVTANRGIAGERSDEVATRLDSLAKSAKVVLLLIGTNDLTFRVPEDTIVSTVETIVAGLKERFPTARIIVQSVMPRTVKWRRRIDSLNARYVAVARDAGVEYLDLWPALAGPDGAIRPNLSLDALHLNGQGYRLWVAELERVLAA